MSPTIRERMAGYRRHGDIPPTAPEYTRPSIVVRLFGAALVGIVGSACALVLSIPLYALAVAGIIPMVLAYVLALPFLWISYASGLYIGGPVADHVLGIPREEVSE